MSTPQRRARIADLIVSDAEGASPRPRDLILGEDGRVHHATVVRTLSGTSVSDAICGAVPLRPLGPRERWWARDEHRICATCGTDQLREGPSE